MNTTTRFVALALMLCMFFSVLPGTVNAVADSKELPATEIPGLSRLDTDKNIQSAAAYQDDEIVTVIVMMDEPSVLDYFSVSTFANRDEETSAGQAVSQFLTSTDAKALSVELMACQNQVIDKIEAVTDSKTEEMEVLAQWTNVVNAMAIRIPYGKLDEIKSTAGVLRAYVQHEFERPEELIQQSGKAAYSYDMVGLKDVWNDGFTGEGMLIAVLDTGLDLTYTTWGDSRAPITDVRRVHEAFTEHSFRTTAGKENVRYTEESMRLFLRTTQLIATTGMNGDLIIYDHNDPYKNLKVPYACDYAEGDMNVQPSTAAHGTHVSGTIVGYAVDEEGVVKFSGVAPDAQLLAMKVFPDDENSGAQEYAIINALEDAALLGADVMNLSLGSTNGYEFEDAAAFHCYKRLQESGIVFMVSAGNSAFSSMLNNRGDYNLSSDPEVSMVGSPSTYDGNLSIASFDNAIATQTILTWTDIAGTETTINFLDPFEEAMKSMFTDQDIPVILVDGYGTYDDYYNAGFRSYYGYSEKGEWGIALVKRGGGISFLDKINMATRFNWSYYDSSKGYCITESPIKAVIIYDEDPTAESLIYMSVDTALITSCFISGKDGASMAAAAQAAKDNGTHITLRVEPEDRIVENPTAGQLSDFSSWGAGPGLELKPDISAPGGNIWSAVIDQNFYPSDPSGYYSDYTGSYAMMSGTSMAAPHMSGIAALVRQYVQEKLKCGGTTAADLTELLLVSTAIPQKDPNGVFYSPRGQGAGLVNASAAVSTPAYITVDDMFVGKIELKDDPSRTGSYTMAFSVNNLTDKALTYNGTLTALRPDTTVDDQGHTFMLSSEVLLKTMDLGEITVPANGSNTVTITLELTAAEKAALDQLFPNGIYIEGFITLTAANGTDPQIGLPFLGFYGDWTAAPIFDSALWTDAVAEGESYLDADVTWGVSVLGYFDGYAYYNLGQNPFDPTAYDNQPAYYNENITLSPNGLFKSVNNFVLHQMREAKIMVVEVRNARTGQLYYRDFAAYRNKNFYNYTYGMVIPSSAMQFTETAWDGTDLQGNILPSGTQCLYTITAYGDGDYPMMDEEGYTWTDFEAVIPGEKEPTFNGHPMDKAGDVIVMDVMVDNEAPKLVNSTVSCIEEDGRIYMTGTFVDDGSIASVEIIPQIKRTYNMQNNPYADPDYYEYGMDESNPFYSELIYDPDVNTWSFKVDVTEYAHTKEAYSGENHYYNFEWTGNVFIFGGDYGGNDRGYGVTVKTDSGLVLSTTSAKLYVGEEFDLSVIDNTGSDSDLTRTSTNPDVATVDEYGHVIAIAPGQTEIVISNGDDEAVCVVAVEERPTEILDFDLSMKHFSGLKPDGSFVVNVINLKPADVEITSASWKVFEDDPDWAGLLTVSKDTASVLSGRVSLNASNDDGEAPSAGSGRLEVTLNGVTRSMTFSWDELYESYDEDGLVSDLYYLDQTIYVTQGETAELVASYRQNHSFINVELYTLEGYESYGYNNLMTSATGLMLDGPGFVANGGTWNGRLVALPGYELPQDIKVVTHYDYGYESEMYRDAYYSGFTYDSTTGEIVVKEAPYGASNILIIRADGIPTEGAPGGTLSGEIWDMPDSSYGPFEWTLIDGNGLLTTGEIEEYYETKNGAFFTPSEPGVSYITASSKDGKYSVNFAVICYGIQAEKLTLDSNKLILYVGDTYQLNPVLSPEPTLDIDKELVYESFDPETVIVDANGLITAVSEGYAYINVETASGAAVKSYVLVEVLPCMSHTYGDWEITTEAGCETPGVETRKCTKCGDPDNREIPATGHTYGDWTVTTEPSCERVGTEKRSCACGDFETRDIPATGHAYGSWTVTAEPGCECVGTEKRSCACGDFETCDIPATGHSYNSVVTRPTESEKGYTTHTCTQCGHSYVDSYTEKLPPKDPTNSQTGDSFHEALWLTLLMISALAMLFLTIFIKKKTV